ncbi:MAG TPA: hypothetical protein PLR99_29845, partial [Polyangiaceae bacterium]|nr:hypothetical protein [Polyangiaceae bacterium]
MLGTGASPGAEGGGSNAAAGGGTLAGLPAGAGGAFRVLLYAMVLLVGTLVGLEIPLVMRILKRQ